MKIEDVQKLVSSLHKAIVDSVIMDMRQARDRRELIAKIAYLAKRCYDEIGEKMYLQLYEEWRNKL